MKNLLLLIGLVGTSSVGLTSYDAAFDNIVESVETKIYEEVAIESNDEIKFYVNENNIEQINSATHNTNMVFNDGVETLVENNEVFEVAKYNFIYNTEKYNGKIFADSSISIECLSGKIDEIIAEIKEDTFFKGRKNDYTTFNNLNAGITWGSSWEVYREERNDVILDSKNDVVFADYSEWTTILHLNGLSTGAEYYAFLNEVYVSPNPHKSNYRNSHLSFEIRPLSTSDNLQLRSYEPKVKNPSMQVSYGMSVGGEISENGGSINTEISSSYTTLLQSPKITSKGSVYDDKVLVGFEYLKPFDDKGIFHDYNISETYQTCTAIYKVTGDLNYIIFVNNRKVGIQQDAWGWWESANYLLDTTIYNPITIVR